MIRTLALAAAAAFALSAPALAVDWNGFYVGKLGFYNHTDFDFFLEEEGECDEIESEEEAFFCLLTGGGLDEVGVAKVFGYNWQNGNFVLGIDGMVAWQSMHELTELFEGFCELISECPEDVPNMHKISVQAMGRLGIVVTDNVMIYGAAGFGASRLGCSDCESSEEEWWSYAAVAAGIEVAANENFVWRTHVQYSHSLGLEDPISAWAVATGAVWQIN